MKILRTFSIIFVLVLLTFSTVLSVEKDSYGTASSLYQNPPRWLVDVPTAGTLPRGYYNIGVRFYPDGGAIGSTNIGLSDRLQLGISYGADRIISDQHPRWNNEIEFSIKLSMIAEMEYFPAIAVGFSSQGFGRWDSDYGRYAFKSRGFYAVASRSFYFYQWTSGWHFGINRSLEDDGDMDKDFNLFFGADATFNYNLAILMEYDAALNDNRSTYRDGDPAIYGRGRGYLNMSIKWLFAENLELEALLRDLLVNQRQADTFTRELRLTYVDRF